MVIISIDAPGCISVSKKKKIAIGHLSSILFVGTLPV